METGALLAQRYSIDTKLGEGGMGIVYKAHDTLLDRPVAIKTLSPALVGVEGLRRLQREAQSAAKLTHTNIVGIYDVIDDGDARLIVMEYVPGQTLRERIPLPWNKAIEIATQVCEALDYAHAHGVIHRDIKPENIVITADGAAKVMDFGLARSEGRSRLTQTGMIVGTVAYMAPEQALQGMADARSDLYALGCVLYELITGRPPFEAEDPIAVITQHINIPPVAPRFYSPTIPPALEAIILKLLAKDPASRYRSARDVGAALEGLRTISTAQIQPQVKVAGAELVQAVRRGVLIGRDEEMRILKGVLDEAVSGEGRLIPIAGQTGVGKTRLVEELITYAHLRGVKVLSAKCDEGETPYEPFSRMLREYLRISTAEEVREALGDYATDLARLTPEIKQKIGSLPESIPLPPEQERARLFESVTRLFAILSKSGPLLLFVDDLHLADSATLQLLRYFAPSVAAERILLIAAYHTEELDRTPALAEALRHLRRERYASALDVKPLTVKKVGELIKSMANHPTIPVRFTSRIFEVTEGNPYFIEEVINALFEKGTLYIKDGQWSTDFDEGARYAEMPVPATIRGAIDSRLQQLSEECRQALTHAAVIGRQFQLDILAQVTGKHEEELLDHLDQALAARLLREVRAGGEDRYEFTQSMVREVIYEGISRHRRRRMHMRAAEALEQVYGDRQRERAGELADHFLEAGEEERAIPYVVAAGEQAEALFAHEEAIRRLETARELLEDAGKPDHAMRLLERLGDPYFHSGQLVKAVEYYQRALEYYEAQNLRPKIAELRRKIGHAYHIRRDFAAAIPTLEQSLQEFGDESGRDVLMLYLDLARAYDFTGDPERAISWAQRALDEAKALGATDQLAMAHAELGTAYGFLRQLNDSDAHYREAIRLTQHSKSYLGKSALRRSINNLGVMEEVRGNLRAGLDARKKALEIAEEVRDQPSIAFQLDNVAWNLWALGEWQSARAHWNRIIALGERAGGFLRWVPVRISLVQEDWEAALQGLQASLREAEQRRDAQSVFVTTISMAETALMLGRYEDAEQHARRALDLKQFHADRDPPNLLAESLARQGRFDEAQGACDQAEANARAIEATGLWGTIHHIRGLIAAGAGRPNEAVKHFDEAIRVYDEFPQPYAQARVFEDLGAFYEKQDRIKALEVYGRALAIFERLGAKKSMQRVKETIEQLRAGEV